MQALREFTGLPHRSQWVADVRGVRFVDDSKGTNVGATLAAVAGMPGPLVLIAGGQGKGQDFAPLAAAFRGKVRHVVLLGQDAKLLARRARGRREHEFAKDMDDAVRAPRARRAPATPCCCRRRARASTCSATTPIAATCSRRAVRRAARLNIAASPSPAQAPARGASRSTPVLVLTVAGLLLLGLVMMTSASVSIADKQVHEPLYYFDRQMVGVRSGCVGAVIAMAIPTARVGSARPALLLIALRCCWCSC